MTFDFHIIVNRVVNIIAVWVLFITLQINKGSQKGISSLLY